MQLFLSGAEAFGAIQNDFNKSLGGFMSSTPMPNGKVNSLFTDIAQRALRSEIPIEETVALFLCNNSGSNKADVTLTQIYSTLFEKDDNLAEFEWAAVTPIDNKRIEKISSKMEIPFYANFNNITSRRADGLLIVLTSGLSSETISILGVTVTLSGNTIASLLNDVKLAFNGNATYNCLIKDDATLYFQFKTIGVNTNSITLNTTGSASATPSAFSNGFDGGVLLTSLLEKDSVLGLWIKRTIKNSTPPTCLELDASSDTIDINGVIVPSEVPKPRTLENLEVLIEWT